MAPSAAETNEAEADLMTPALAGGLPGTAQALNGGDGKGKDERDLRAMASNLLAMASNLRAMASNLLAMASNLY